MDLIETFASGPLFPAWVIPACVLAFGLLLVLGMLRAKADRYRAAMLAWLLSAGLAFGIGTYTYQAQDTFEYERDSTITTYLATHYGLTAAGPMTVTMRQSRADVLAVNHANEVVPVRLSWADAPDMTKHALVSRFGTSAQRERQEQWLKKQSVSVTILGTEVCPLHKKSQQWTSGCRDAHSVSTWAPEDASGQVAPRG